MSEILLTVAIPTLKERRNIFLPKLEKYYNTIKMQGLQNEVEIITHEDDREITIGEKRNILIDKAKGKMISFVDDDDEITDDYFLLITEKIKNNKNIDAIEIFCHIIDQTNHNYNTYIFKGLPKNFINKLPNNFQNSHKNNLKNVKISQFNPIKTEIVKSIKYPKIPIHEDFIFAEKVQSKIKNVDCICNKCIYIYYYNINTSAVQNYRKPKTVLIQKLNELYLDNKNTLEYDSNNGNITDPRYFKLMQKYKEL